MQAVIVPSDFLVASKNQRGFSLAIALTLTLLVIAQLSLHPMTTPIQNRNTTSLLISWINPQSKPPEVKTVVTDTTKIKPASIPKSTSIPTNAKQTRKETQPEAITTTTPVTTPSTEKSISFDSVAENLNATTPPKDLSKLNGRRFDSNAIRQAYEDSKSDLEKMADASGQPLESRKLTKHERFQDAAKAATKPDCLRQGASILSIFVVAYQVATDHCK